MPGTSIEGEHCQPSPEAARIFQEDGTPPAATAKYCVLKPFGQFTTEEPPLAVTFFARPEVLSGLHSLASCAAGSHLAAACPLGTACGGIIAWPLVYRQRGEEKAALGGFDISAREFLKTDELIFSIPLSLYRKMLDVMEESALVRHTWGSVRKKVLKSRRTWGEGGQIQVVRVFCFCHKRPKAGLCYRHGAL